MSGPFGSDTLLYSKAFYSHPIDQSLRFNDNDSAYLSRTPASAGNRKTWTWSAWVKRGNLGNQHLLDARSGGNINAFTFNADNEIGSSLWYGYSAQYGFNTSAKFRDPSAWYHVVIKFDSTQATASDRLKVYVNGVNQSLYLPSGYPSIYPAQNADSFINSTLTHSIGTDNLGSGYLDGYLAEVHLVDGQALDASSFGENKSGVWIPKRYSGSYGTNGFYLDFGNSGSLGADSSGNSNNWTPNNLAATDQVLDSPTNNFCTLNQINRNSTLTLAEGNLSLTSTAAQGAGCGVTMATSSGKWYYETVYVSGVSSYIHVGVIDSDATVAQLNTTNTAVNGTIYRGDGNIYENSGSGWSVTQTVTAASTGDIIGVAYDLDAQTCTYYLNNTQLGSSVSISYMNPEVMPYPLFGYFTAVMILNFGQDSSFAGQKTAQGYTDANGIGDFYYEPPSGYLALCTANLPDPAIDPALDDVPEDYFNTVLYTGNGSSQDVTGVGFDTDFIWIKARSGVSRSHALFDQVRGDNAGLYSDLTVAEGTWTGQEFITDGYKVDITYSSETNASGISYVAWNWKADGSGVSNTDGTITSTVSANQKAGFSIVSYASSGSDTDTAGHGLAQTPDLTIHKNRSAVTPWYVGFTLLDGSLDYMELNSTAAALNSTAPAPTSTTISGLAWPSGQEVVAYCFHSVEGYSKIGSYTGNGSTDGPFVYCGFRPAFVLIKNASRASTRWLMFDAGRNPENIVTNLLLADGSDAESSNSWIDFLSNGFKARIYSPSFNQSGDTYIFMAFAEMPFKYSNAR